jgi:hypothetical protein
MTDDFPPLPPGFRMGSMMTDRGRLDLIMYSAAEMRAYVLADRAKRAEPVAHADVLAERRRQIEREGWTPEHDDEHSDGSMALAAACYASNAATWAAKGTTKLQKSYSALSISFRWPWSEKWWKPKSQRHDLVRAAALILAEIERLDRAAAPKETPAEPGGIGEKR